MTTTEISMRYYARQLSEREGKRTEMALIWAAFIEFNNIVPENTPFTLSYLAGKIKESCDMTDERVLLLYSVLDVNSQYHPEYVKMVEKGKFIIKEK